MMSGAWCILRTSPGRTLSLADSLAGAGFEVWTPRQMTVRKRPRSTIRIEREMPIAPTFIFAKSSHLSELAALRSRPVNPHPPFSIFRHAGRIPLIADAEVEGLRREEERLHVRSRRSKRRAYVLGQRVRLTEGAFAGMSGVVERATGKYVLVAFGGNFEMEIGSWLLSPDEVQHEPSHIGAAA